MEPESELVKKIPVAGQKWTGSATLIMNDHVCVRICNRIFFTKNRDLILLERKCYLVYTVYSKKVNKKDLYPANSVSGAT